MRVDRREFGVLGQQPEFFLAPQNPRPDRLVSLVEDAFVPVGPLLEHVVRRVGRVEGEVHEEGLVGIDDLGVPDEFNSFVGQVLGDVVALFGRGRRVDRVVVVDQVRVPAARLAAEEAVEPLEAAPEGPAPPLYAAMLISSPGVRCHLPTHYVL